MTTRILLTLAAVLYVAMIVLALRPAFDLDAARLFYAGQGHFVGTTPAATIVRYTAWALPFCTFAAMLVASLLGRAGLLATRWTPRGRSLLFLAVALAVGPGFIVHGILKEISHRPRPYAVTAFGGQNAFRPYDRFDGACAHNCSFASGETAAATWMLAPASLVPPPWTGLALGGATLFALATGLLRMAFGAHFLSDVCGAALVTVLVVFLSRGLIKPRP